MRKRNLSWPEAAVALLLLTLIASVFAIVAQAMRAKDMALERAERDAGLLVEFAHVAHEHHTRISSNSVLLEADPAMGPSEFDPLTGGLSADFTQRLSEHFPKLDAEVYFSVSSIDTSQNAMEGDLDKFEQDAFAAFQQDNKRWFVRTEWPPGGDAVMRLANPITIDKTCVVCHSETAWDSPETEFGLGDVVGMREVAIVVPRRDLNLPGALWSFFVLIVVACILGFGVLYPALRRAARQRTHYKGMNVLLGVRAERLARQANTDALTGLSNRRFFDNILDAYVNEHTETRTHLGLILFDIDHFKSVNDLQGHVVGDDVIARIAKLTKANVRRNERPARVGGEEFAVLCPDGDRAGLMELADRLRRLVATQQFRTASGDGHFGVTISLGVAQLKPGDDPASLYKRADDHMYRAKRLGRNQVRGDMT